jgi:hypothetical protein
MYARILITKSELILESYFKDVWKEVDVDINSVKEFKIFI